MAVSLSTPVGRIRFALGDQGDESLLPDGDAQYRKLLARFGNNEDATYQAAALALAAYYATQPIRIGANGKSLDYSERVPMWLRMGRGEIAYPYGADGSAVVHGSTTTIGRLAAGKAVIR